MTNDYAKHLSLGNDLADVVVNEAFSKLTESSSTFLICKKLNVRENEPIMIGDSATELNAGHNANMPVVLVGYGYTDNKNIYNDADLVINNFSQLTELID